MSFSAKESAARFRLDLREMDVQFGVMVPLHLQLHMRASIRLLTLALCSDPQRTAQHRKMTQACYEN